MAEVNISTTTNFFSCTTDSSGKIIEATHNNLTIPTLGGTYESDLDIDNYLYSNKSIEELQEEYSEDPYSLEYIQAYFCYVEEVEEDKDANVTVSGGFYKDEVKEVTEHSAKWGGEFTSGRKDFEELYDNITIGLNYSNAVMSFINSSEMSSITKNLCIGRAACLAEDLIGSANNLVTDIYNFPVAIKNLKWDSLDNIFESAETICDFTYSILGEVDELYTYGTELYDFISGYEYGKTWDDICDNCSNAYNNTIDLFSDSDTPGVSAAIWDSVCNLTVVQELYTEYFQISKSIASAWAAITSMKAPTNLASCQKLVGKIRKVLKELQSVKRSVERSKKAIEDVQVTIENQIQATKNMVNSMDFLKIFKMLMTLTAKFIEKPTQYAAKYPYNLGYVTAGGHTIEVDNTDGKERMNVKSKSGSSAELEPNGDVYIKVNNDFQNVVKGNADLKTNGDFTVLTDGKSEIYSDINKVVGKTSNYISAPDVNMNADTLSVSSTFDTMISSGTSTSLSSNVSTEISSNGLVKISSNTGIVLDAPVIMIGSGTCSSIYLSSTGVIQSLSSTENHVSGSITNRSGIYRINATNIRMTGFINLN